MTPRDVITRARETVGDSRVGNYRTSDEALLRHVNDAMAFAHINVPSIFYATGEVQCVADEALQGVSLMDVDAIVDVLRVKGGGAVLPADLKTLDAFDPDWRGATAAAAKNWMRLADDPARFLISPPAPAGQVLEVLYLPRHADYGMDDAMPLPSGAIEALHDYVVFRVESKDAEHVESGRSTAFLKIFTEKLKAGG